MWFGLSKPQALSCTGGVPGTSNSCANNADVLWSSNKMFEGGAYWTSRTLDFSSTSESYGALTTGGDVVARSGTHQAYFVCECVEGKEAKVGIIMCYSYHT